MPSEICLPPLFSPVYRCNQGPRSSGMESLYFEPIPAASDDQTDTIMAEPYGSPESVRSLTGTESDPSYESSTWALESACASPDVSPLYSLEFEDELGQVEDLDQMDEMEEVLQVDEEMEEDQVEQEDQAEEDQILQPPPSITSYIRRWELKLMRKFRKQLDEKTRMLQADIKKHQDALEMINRQAASGNAVIQVSDAASHHLSR
ncbi:circadian clock protein PASD1 isoform X4 [Manis pentadactyla]|uniref:circadian clock protein PASD1 isoform X4 n=1 Tax=Manis pentadactyla TaxID=143292 RepID=UPI00255C69B1|nr:circadian clock protein PASD1 isoform X4 [Manis pentadactyla]